MGISYDRGLLLNVIEDYPGKTSYSTYAYVNAYEETLGWGGAEEGGWWYTISEPLASIHVVGPKQARKALDLLESLYTDSYSEVPAKSSVAHDAADLSIRLSDEYAEYQPQRKPHYE